MRLADVRIGRKLAMGFACVLAIFALVSVAIFGALARVESAAAANDAADAVLVDLERLVSARFDQSQTARGFILVRIERHAHLYALATKLFGEMLATTRIDAASAPDSAITLDAIAKLADTAADWQREVGDPEVDLTRNPATVAQAIEIAKSPHASTLMQKFRETQANVRAVVEHALLNSQVSQALALSFAKGAEIVGGIVAVISSLLVGLALYRSIARPISGMTDVMRRLAAGDTGLEVPARGQADELGSMAAAVENFRTTAIEKRRIDAEAAASRALLEEALAARARLSDENSRLANVDSLTDLPNRRQFFIKLGESLDTAAREERRFIVGMIDLDGFKSVNDIHGHTTGDKVLIEAGRRMREVCGDLVFLARLGGDEFAVIIGEDVDDAGVLAFGGRMCSVLDAPFTFPGIITQVSGSIGFATFPEAGSSAELLFERADYALYHAKENSRGRPVIFSSEQETEIRQFGAVEECLRDADLELEMSLNFQPIFDVDRGEAIAFETLARWDSPKLGRVPPAVFVRVAERSDLIIKLTRTLLRKTLDCVAGWPPDIRVSFNLSARDLASPEMILNIMTMVRESGVVPGRIDFEVTEAALMTDFDQSSKSLRMLKALGAGISLDDFGRGYSSLSNLHRVPFDKIKVARNVIKEAETGGSGHAIIKTVIGLCLNLDLICIVKGVETTGQADIVRSFGCTTMQGNLFCKPMPARDVAGFLHEAGAWRQIAEAS